MVTINDKLNKIGSKNITEQSESIIWWLGPIKLKKLPVEFPASVTNLATGLANVD